MNWYLEVLKKYATFTGRARRQEFWMFTLINFLISIVLGIIDSAAGLSVGDADTGVIGLLYSLFVLLPSLAVMVRRAHDIGKSGWYPFLLLLIPTILLVLLSATLMLTGMWLGILLLLAAFVYYIVLMATDSQYGPNKYGPNPKGLGNDDELEIEEHLITE